MIAPCLKSKLADGADDPAKDEEPASAKVMRPVRDLTQAKATNKVGEKMPSPGKSKGSGSPGSRAGAAKGEGTTTSSGSGSNETGPNQSALLAANGPNQSTISALLSSSQYQAAAPTSGAVTNGTSPAASSSSVASMTTSASAASSARAMASVPVAPLAAATAAAMGISDSGTIPTTAVPSAEQRALSSLLLQLRAEQAPRTAAAPDGSQLTQQLSRQQLEAQRSRLAGLSYLQQPPTLTAQAAMLQASALPQAPSSALALPQASLLGLLASALPHGSLLEQLASHQAGMETNAAGLGHVLQAPSALPDLQQLVAAQASSQAQADAVAQAQANNPVAQARARAEALQQLEAARALSQAQAMQELAAARALSQAQANGVAQTQANNPVDQAQQLAASQALSQAQANPVAQARASPAARSQASPVTQAHAHNPASQAQSNLGLNRSTQQSPALPSQPTAASDSNSLLQLLVAASARQRPAGSSGPLSSEALLQHLVSAPSARAAAQAAPASARQSSPSLPRASTSSSLHQTLPPDPSQLFEALTRLPARRQSTSPSAPPAAPTMDPSQHQLLLEALKQLSPLLPANPTPAQTQMLLQAVIQGISQGQGVQTRVDALSSPRQGMNRFLNEPPQAAAQAAAQDRVVRDQDDIALLLLHQQQAHFLNNGDASSKAAQAQALAAQTAAAQAVEALAAQRQAASVRAAEALAAQRQASQGAAPHDAADQAAEALAAQRQQLLWLQALASNRHWAHQSGPIDAAAAAAASARLEASRDTHPSAIPGVVNAQARPDGGAVLSSPAAAVGGESSGPTPTAMQSKDRRWLMRYEELLDFRRRYGHCRVPHGYAENRKLSWWVMNQRAQYQLKKQGKKSWLSDERVQMLDAVQFDWNPVVGKSC